MKINDSYIKEMYPEDPDNDYPKKLCDYISESYLGEFKDRNVNFLEVGYGKGNHILLFSNIFKGNFSGIDINPVDIPGVECKKCNLEFEKIDYPDNTFDIIFSKSVIEHVVNTDNFISEIRRVLKPDGCAIVMAPDWQSQMKNFFDDYTHVKPFTARSMTSAATINGLDNNRVEKMVQLPIVWKFPILKYACDIIDIVFPESFKWKTKSGRNTNDRKWVRFSKERMLICIARKSQ